MISRLASRSGIPHDFKASTRSIWSIYTILYCVVAPKLGSVRFQPRVAGPSQTCPAVRSTHAGQRQRSSTSLQCHQFLKLLFCQWRERQVIVRGVHSHARFLPEKASPSKPPRILPFTLKTSHSNPSNPKSEESGFLHPLSFRTPSELFPLTTGL